MKKSTSAFRLIEMRIEREGMSRFLLFVAVFSLMVVAGLAVGETLVRMVPSPYRAKHLKMISSPDDVSTLIMGSSMTYYGLRASDIDSCFNLANVSQNPDYDNLLLEKYIGGLRNLRTVVIPISYSTFVEAPFEGSDEWWYAINYKVYMDVDRHPDLSRYNFEVSHFSVYSGKLKNKLTGKEGVRFDSFGDGMDFPASERPANWLSTAGTRVVSNTPGHTKWVGFNRDKLQSTIELCISHGVEPVIITTPTTATHRSLLDRHQLMIMRRETDNLRRKYGLRYFDYMGDSRFTDDDFWDADHLNNAGAAKLTGIFCREAGLVSR